MDYEKAYKEALERAKGQLKEAKVFDYKEGQIAHNIRTTTYAIFPELAESEDERIKRGIVKFLKENKDFPEDWIAWLEKQGERSNIVEQLTAFAQHLNKRGAFRDDLCMDFEHEAQSFIESQMEKRKKS